MTVIQFYKKQKCIVLLFCTLKTRLNYNNLNKWQLNFSKKRKRKLIFEICM
jgi:hypothetical protein